MSACSSLIYIVSDIPMDNRYQHSLFFETPNQQHDYFMSKQIHSFTGYTYLRKNWSIKVNATMSQAHKWTYLFFVNLSHEYKTYYYFINQVNYINDSTVELELELDVIQTYMFDWKLKECFVERCHTVSDKIGEHTMDEGIDTGDLIDAKSMDLEDFREMCILFMTTVDSSYSSAVANVYDGVFSGLRVYAVAMEDYQVLGDHLDNLNEAGKIDSIVAIWMYPRNVLRIGTSEWQSGTLNRVLGIGYDDFTMDGLSSVKEDLFEGYGKYVKNNKLFSYPYNFLFVTNNNGGGATYKYERFNNPDKLEFQCYGAISPDASVKIGAYGYDLERYESGVELGSFPSCAWDSDTYKVWLAQNQNQMRFAHASAVIQAGGAVLGALGSAATLNVGGALGSLGVGVNALMQVQSQIAQRKDMEVQPHQARGNHSTNVNVASDKQTFTFLYKSVTWEFAEMIDDYFTRYGYKVNRIMKPRIDARPRFTYVKTIGCTIAGPIGNEDRIKIESIFDSGITFWKDTVNPCDYTADNSPS